MMLSKSCLCARKTVLVVLKKYQVVPSSSFHYLQSPNKTNLNAVNSVLIPQLTGIISRFESSQAIRSKDVILQVPAEPSSTQIPVPHGPSPIANEALPDIPVAGSTISDTLPEIISEAIVPLNKLGEATLQSVGLGCPYTPVGWIQRIIEFFHVTFDIPYWSSIAVCVVIARLLIFPLVIKHQRNSAKMHNVMPEMTVLQTKMQNAKIYGNHVEMMKYGQELARFIQENQISPFKTMMMPLVQAPIFLSFFIALRKMSEAPLESLKEGGMLWFVDLTSADQFCALPAITCVTLWLTLELGADFSRMPSASVSSRYMPYFLKCVPIIVFPFIMNFPSAICVYWASANFVSLTQVAFLKIPAVRIYFQIDPKKSEVKSAMKSHRKGFVTDMKSAYKNIRVAKEIAERERLDEASFKRAGRQPPAKTYKYNPVHTSQTIHAKKQ